MEIANFLSTPSRRNLLLAVSAICLLSACESVRKHEFPQTKPAHGAGSVTAGGPQSSAQNAPPETPAIPGRPGVVPPTPPEPPAVPAVAPPPRQQPNVGVIFGPGGMKTYAELGVLHEFARARVPIQAVVGFEWGAVIAGLYAQTGQINDAEWKAFRLKQEELPEKGFLSGKAASQDVSALKAFLESGFGSATVEKARVNFACSAAQVAADQTLWYYKGSFREAVSRCLPYPPLYKPHNGSVASPTSIDDAAAWLRAHGANLVVLVDVVGASDVFEKSSDDNYAQRTLWGQVRREMMRAKSPVVNYVIHVNTSGTPLDGFDGRRALMEAGQKAATDPLAKMVSTYGF